METIIMASVIVLAALLVTAYILVLSDRRQTKPAMEPELTKRFTISEVSELKDDTEEELAREEAEKSYIFPRPEIVEPEEDFEKLELYVTIAKKMTVPRCMRLIAGTFINQYSNYKFFKDLLRAMTAEGSAGVLDAIEMARNPQLYVDNHLECPSECTNPGCRFSRLEEI